MQDTDTGDRRELAFVPWKPHLIMVFVICVSIPIAYTLTSPNQSTILTLYELLPFIIITAASLTVSSLTVIVQAGFVP